MNVGVSVKRTLCTLPLFVSCQATFVFKTIMKLRLSLENRRPTRRSDRLTAECVWKLGEGGGWRGYTRQSDYDQPVRH